MCRTVILYVFKNYTHPEEKKAVILIGNI